MPRNKRVLTNAGRAQFANLTLKFYNDKVVGGDMENAVRDLLCDLLHYCDRHGEIDFETELEIAKTHFNEEL